MHEPATPTEEFPLSALEPRALQVVGAGAAGAGIVVAADRLGLLDRLVDGGLVFLERAPRGRFASLGYDIESNSPGIEFLSEIHPGGLFAELLTAPEARALADAGDRTVPLRAVSRLIERLLTAFEDHATARTGTAPVRYGVTVRRLCILPDGTFVSFDDAGRPLVRSRAAVLALGGAQVLDHRILPRNADGEVPPIVGSDELLRGEQDELCEQVIAAGGRIAVIGGSHSGWSVVERLLRLGERRLAHGQLLLADRSPTTLYFPDAQQARAAGMPPRSHQICPETGKVNRFDGLRGAAQALYRRFAAGELPALETHGPVDQRWRIANLALLVVATGYRPRQIELHDHRGIPVETEVEFGNLKLTSKGAVVCRGRGPIRNLFGLGLGHAIRRYGSYRVGVNVFHGEAAGRILQECELGARAIGPGVVGTTGT